jgi:hypothetical protein
MVDAPRRILPKRGGTSAVEGEDRALGFVLV